MPNVFISYAHESAEHEDRVLRFASALVNHGVNVELDRYHPRPPQGWTGWAEQQLRPENADFVLMICTAEYSRRVQNRTAIEEGRGVFWEAQIIYNYLYSEKNNTRFIPILFASASVDNIPVPIRHHHHYKIDAFDLSDAGYRALYRELTGQPEVVKPRVGTIVPLSTIETLPPLPARKAFPLSPAESTVEVFTLTLNDQLRMTADERELLVTLDELMLKVENGEKIAVRVIAPEITAVRDELTALRQIARPTLDQRARIVTLERSLRGRFGNEPSFDQLLSEVITSLLADVVPRVSTISGPKAAFDSIAETLRLYADPKAVSGLSLDCLVKQNDWVLKVELEESIVEKVAADHVGGLDGLVWHYPPVYVADFPPQSIRQYFVPQLLVGYFQLKYWRYSSRVPDIEEVFDFQRVRVGLH